MARPCESRWIDPRFRGFVVDMLSLHILCKPEITPKNHTTKSDRLR